MVSSSLAITLLSKSSVLLSPLSSHKNHKQSPYFHYLDNAWISLLLSAVCLFDLVTWPILHTHVETCAEMKKQHHSTMPRVLFLTIWIMLFGCLEFEPMTLPCSLQPSKIGKDPVQDQAILFQLLMPCVLLIASAAQPNNAIFQCNLLPFHF